MPARRMAARCVDNVDCRAPRTSHSSHTQTSRPQINARMRTRIGSDIARANVTKASTGTLHIGVHRCVQAPKPTSKERGQEATAQGGRCNPNGTPPRLESRANQQPSLHGHVAITPRCAGTGDPSPGSRPTTSGPPCLAGNTAPNRPTLDALEKPCSERPRSPSCPLEMARNGSAPDEHGDHAGCHGAQRAGTARPSRPPLAHPKGPVLRFPKSRATEAGPMPCGRRLQPKCGRRIPARSQSLPGCPPSRAGRAPQGRTNGRPEHPKPMQPEPVSSRCAGAPDSDARRTAAASYS